MYKRKKERKLTKNIENTEIIDHSKVKNLEGKRKKGKLNKSRN